MGKGKRKNKARRARCRAAQYSGFVEASQKGCYVMHRECPEWALGMETLTEGMFGEGVPLASLPEISIDPESAMLSVLNACTETHKVFNLTVGGQCLPVQGGREGEETQLEPGVTRDSSGVSYPCVSFVLLVPPMSVVDVCYLSSVPLHSSLSNTDAFLESDIKVWDAASLMDDFRREESFERAGLPVVGFPLGDQGPFLCSQGFGGHFTHFFKSNFFAVDLECPVGTSVLAVADGQVVDIRQNENVEGISTANLFHWNSITLQIDLAGSCFVEYVHISHKSCLVSVGDKVEKGQTICKSGCVGYSPSPHLHLQLSREYHDQASAIPFAILCRLGDRDAELRAQTLRAGSSYCA